MIHKTEPDSNEKCFLVCLLAAALVLSATRPVPELLAAAPVDAQPMEGTLSESDLLTTFLLAILGESADTRRTLAAEAIHTSEEVLSTSPKDVTAHLIMISALGTMARGMSTIESARGRYASRSKEFLEHLYVLAPAEAWTHALYGAWHLEVTRRSPMFGPLFLGADSHKGIEMFEKALVLKPADPLLSFAYSLSLLSLDESIHAPRALDLLASIGSKTNLPMSDQKYVKVFRESKTLQRMIIDKDFKAAGELARSLL